jgi:peptidoglycan LD-endopeptidase LytH
MKKLFLLIFLFFLHNRYLWSQSEPKVINEAVANFHFLYQNIRDGEIAENVARDSVAKILPLLKQYYIDNAGVEEDETKWTFPVEGYGMNMIGGKRGSDYIPNNYNFYNSHFITCHAAHDIFIVDKNQDKIDDLTNLPVNILSFTSGIVVGVEYFWESSSPKKGGNYIYIYEPFSQKIYYYAHNDLVFAQLGDIVKAGDVIATMGRTGFNAYKERSPTHLHFAILVFDNNAFGTPLKPYDFLAKAIQKKQN